MSLITQPLVRRDARPNLALLVSITMLGTMALHMFMPALPAAAKDLAASSTVIQLSVTLYLAGLAVGQLLYGPLSDRFGRRPLVLGGMVLYLAATVFAALAQNAGEFIVARVLQSLGGCAGLVLGRAMVRDGASSEKTTAALGMLTAAATVGPGIAPVIGGYVAAWAGWRATFVVLASIGAAIFALALLILPETHRRRDPLPGIMPMLRNYAGLMKLRQFRGYALGACCATTSIYSFFSASPFIIVGVLHRPPQEVGLYYLLATSSLTIGSLASSRLVRYFRPRSITRVGSWVQLGGALALIAVELSDMLTPFTLMATVMITAIGGAVAAPPAVALAVSADPKAIGTAAGLYGSLQMLFGGLCIFIVSLWQSDSALPVAAVLAVSALVGQIAFAHGAKAANPIAPAGAKT